MDRMDRDPDLEAVERRLRASRPRPRPGFVESLERSLVHEPARPAARRRPLLAAAAASAAMAAAALGLSVAGVGPLAAGTQDDTKATSKCRYVTVQRRARVAEIVTGARGQARVVYRYRPVERRVRRCG
jgi:hypothetical protein